jgi:hypothetical protein
LFDLSSFFPLLFWFFFFSFVFPAFLIPWGIGALLRPSRSPTPRGQTLGWDPGALKRVTPLAPGSWHDSNIADCVYDKLLHETPPGFWINSDTAFPRCTNHLDYQIAAPAKKGDWLPQSPTEFAWLKVFNDQLVSAWQAAEWGMRSMQGSFSRLKLPMPADNHAFQAEVLELAVRIHQIRCRLVGINQTQTVYQSVKDKFQILSCSFHQMLFPDIQKSCHISRYYSGWL